jgi:hypothetical protein
MSLDDGYYRTAAQLLLELLISNLKSNPTRQSSLRPTYLLAKIERIFSIFKRSFNLFPALREHYESMQNEQKIREMYLREFRMGFDGFDILYDKYLLWEKNE